MYFSPYLQILHCNCFYSEMQTCYSFKFLLCNFVILLIIMYVWEMSFFCNCKYANVLVLEENGHIIIN